MAEEPENRMLFDLRGRRKRVIQVIYVLLAIIMAASLIIIGLPGNINPFTSGNGVVSQDLADSSVDRAEKLQTKLKTEPNNTRAQEELIRARIAAGNNLIEIDSETGDQNITDEASTQYDLAAQTWETYLKATKNDPDQSVAQVIANTLFTLSQDSTIAQFQSNITDAAKAQEFVAKDAEAASKKGDGPSPAGPLATLATYQYYAQQPDEAAASGKKALAATDDKAEKQQIQQQLDSVKKDAARIGKILAKAKKQAKKDGGKSLEQPAGSLGTSSSLTTPQTTP